MREIRMSGLMSGEGKRSTLQRVTAPFLDSTHVRLQGFDDVEQLAYCKRSIIVAPWQFVGGTQFSHVVVVAAAISAPTSQFGKLRELIAVYLSCSRASQSLAVVCSNYTPSVLRDAKEHGLLKQEQ